LRQELLIGLTRIGRLGCLPVCSLVTAADEDQGQHERQHRERQRAAPAKIGLHARIVAVRVQMTEPMNACNTKHL